MGVTIGPAEAYQRAAAMFGETITVLADTEWDLVAGDDLAGEDLVGDPLGDESWSIAQIVAWVVVGDSQITAAVDRGELDEIGDIDPSVLGPNLTSTWRGTAVAAMAGLRRPGAIDEVVDHPKGRLAVSDLVGQRTTENLVRAWDIGRITGRNVEIADDLAEWCLEFWNTHAEAVMGGGVLPTLPIEPPPGAAPAARLLAFTGRKA